VQMGLAKALVKRMPFFAMASMLGVL